MRRVSFLDASACNEDMHVIASLHKIWDDFRDRVLVGKIGCDDRGFSAELLNLIVCLLIALVSLLNRDQSTPKHKPTEAMFLLLE